MELDPSRQYIFGWHPHGILLLSRFAIYGGLWQKVFPGIHFKVRVYIYMGGLRESWIGQGSVARPGKHPDRHAACLSFQ